MSLRKCSPTRSDVAERSNYRHYKPDLRNDFSCRCGYCDSPDEYFGGIRGFQIDHFAPISKFPHLKLIYTNLIYCCPFCNRAKSNKWIGADSNVPNNGLEGFVDPCCIHFDNHLERDSQGRVLAKTELGGYMIKNLKLSLLRHQYVWQAQKLSDLEDRIYVLLEAIKDGPVDSNNVELLKGYVEISKAYKTYRTCAIEA